MKILIITNLFPNCKVPTKGTYSLQQYKALSRCCEIKVVAPLPAGMYSLNEVPLMEEIEGLEVFHPRYVVIPRILRWTYGWTFCQGIKPTVLKLHESFAFEAILAAWAYPDGVGAARVARELNKPYFIEVLGSDVNMHTRHKWRRTQIVRSMTRAERIISVSQGLKQRLVQIGVEGDKIDVVMNGIDKGLFHPMDTVVCRKELGLSPDKRFVLYVGNFYPVKGVKFLVEAMAAVDNTELLLVGDGPERGLLSQMAEQFGVTGRIHFKGRQPHADIPKWMSAADVVCLPSLNEGCPNVVLEALGCGTPVAASAVGAIPEMITDNQNGVLAEAGKPASLAEAINRGLNIPKPVSTPAVMSWEENGRRLYDCLGPLPAHF